MQLANFVLLRRDSYLDYLKTGFIPDTWNRLRNAPLFHSGLCPDDILAIVNKTLSNMRLTQVLLIPGSGALQHHGHRSEFWYKPYEKKESKQTGYGLGQSQQLWRQFSQQSRGRCRGSVAAALLISPRPPGVLKHINDNYWIKDTSGPCQDQYQEYCKLSCCYSCTLCNRAVTKERRKSLLVKKSM